MPYPLQWFAAAMLACATCTAQPPKPHLSIRHAYLFTMASDQKAPFTGCLLIDQSGKITAVLPNDPPACTAADTVVDAAGAWVIPGFVSAHSHLWQSAYRGLAADKTLLGWIDALQLEALAKPLAKNGYGQYLLKVLTDKAF